MVTQRSSATYWAFLALGLILSPVALATGPLDQVAVLFEKTGEAAYSISLQEVFAQIVPDREIGSLCIYRLIPQQKISNHRVFGQQTIPVERGQASPVQNASAEWRNGQLLVEFTLGETSHCRGQLSEDKRSILLSVKKQDDELTRKIREQLQTAKKAMIRDQPHDALSIYTAILEGRKHPLQAEALEGMGVAQERLKDWKAAEETYRKYLERYADEGLATQRVQQRLQGLRLMHGSPPATLREPTARKPTESLRWFGMVSGSFQGYRSKISETNEARTYTFLTTDINLNARYRNPQWDNRFSVSGSYAYDLEDNLGNPERLSSAYVDMAHKESGQQLVIGRQRSSGEGLLGKFDGLRYRKSLSDSWQLGLLVGYPVLSSHNVYVESDKQVIGLSMAFQPSGTPWRGSSFVTQQEESGMTSRQAIGGEFAYQTNRLSALSYFDYDLFFKEINILMANVNWYGESGDSLFMAVDYRRSPTLNLSNALLGQTASNLDELLQQGTLTSDSLEEIALDRTATSQTLTLGGSSSLNRQWHWNTDISAWQISATESSAGVSGFKGTDVETALNLQFVGNGLLQNRDIHWITFRLANLTNSKQILMRLETQWPLTQGWRLRPQLRLYERRYSNYDGSERGLRPLIKVEYVGSKRWNWTCEFAQEWIESDQNNLKVSRQDQSLYTRLDWLF